MSLFSHIFSGRSRGAPGLGLALAAAVAITLIPLPAVAELDAVAACAVPKTLMASTARLPRFAARIARGGPIRIVALGSSSTSGAGASGPQATYPSRLQAEMAKLLPAAAVTVLNKGVAGERVDQMIARLGRDVMDERPDLLIWQMGTNSALMNDDPGRFIEEVARGLDLVREAGIETILMTPQYSPRFENTMNRRIFIDEITSIAELRGIPVIRRYDMMKHWVKSGQMTATEMVNPDGLHLTDRSYACIGHAAAQLVIDLATAKPAVTATTR